MLAVRVTISSLSKGFGPARVAGYQTDLKDLKGSYETYRIQWSWTRVSFGLGWHSGRGPEPVFLAFAKLMTSQGSTAQNSTSQHSGSGSSLGEYARQIRKDPGTKTTPRVFDNDNLPKDDKLSVVGHPDNPTADNASTDANSPSAKSPATPAPAEDEAAKAVAAKQWGDKLAAQKDQVDLLGRELDVLQREYQIRAAAMYADAGNRLRNSGDWDKQDAQYKQQIADKQKALDEAKQKLEDEEEEARKAGVTPAAVQPPAQ